MNARGVVSVAVAATIATVVLALVGEPARTYLDYDFGAFWVMGRLLLEGKDQYDYSTFLAAYEAIGGRALSLVLPGTASAYPLTTSFIFLPFALLPFALAAPLWLVSQIVAAFSALVALARVLVPDTTRRDAFVLIGLVAASQPASMLVEYGNMSGLTLAIAAMTTTFLLTSRPAAAGVSAGVLLLIKPHALLIAMPLIVLALPRAAAVRAVVAAGSTVAVALAASLALDPTWIGDLVSELPRVAAFGERVRLPTLFGLMGPDLVWLSWVVAVACVVGVLAYGRTRPPLRLTIAVAVCVSSFIAPFGHAYDQVVLAIPVLIGISEVSHAAAWRRSVALLGLAIAFVVAPWLLYVLAFQRGDESLNAITPLAVLAALGLAAWLGHQPSTSGTRGVGRPGPEVSVGV